MLDYSVGVVTGVCWTTQWVCGKGCVGLLREPEGTFGGMHVSEYLVSAWSR